MAIDMSTVKEIHYNNKEIKKIEMNGSIVWQKPSEGFTISYSLLRIASDTPATKTVTPTGGVYTLTASDLPTIDLNGNTTDQVIGWTTDGSTQLQAGDTITGNVTLKAIHKITITKTYDWTAGKVSKGNDGSLNVTASHSTTLWNLSSGSSGTYKNSYTNTTPDTSTSKYYGASIRGFNGVVITTQVYPNMSFKIKWNPAVRSVTYAASQYWSASTFYADTYPMILVRDGNTTTKLYKNGNVAANTTTSTITSGSSNNAYITLQYGGWDAGGNGKTSWGRQYRKNYSNGNLAYPSSNQTGNKTDYLYLYMQ